MLISDEIFWPVSQKMTIRTSDEEIGACSHGFNHQAAVTTGTSFVDVNCLVADAVTSHGLYDRNTMVRIVPHLTRANIERSMLLRGAIARSVPLRPGCFTTPSTIRNVTGVTLKCLPHKKSAGEK